MQANGNKRVVLVGQGRTVERYRRLYARNGTFTPVTLAPGQSIPSDTDLVHVLETGAAPLSAVADWLFDRSPPVILPFSPELGPDQFEAAVVALEQRGCRLMLGYAPMYAPPYNKLLHAVKTGIVGRLQGLDLMLPGGVAEFATQMMTGTALSPACVGLAYAAYLLQDQPEWRTVQGDGERAEATFRDGLTFTVRAGQADSSPTLVVTGDASQLRLVASGTTQVLVALRGQTERELMRQNDLDIYCATVKAAGLFVDNRTRNVIPGHAGLALLQSFGRTRKAFDPPATPDPEPSPVTQPVAVHPPRYDLYQKRPVRWGGDGRETPLWEAKFNIESVCNQDCLFCFARDGDLRLTELAGAPELFGRLSSEGIEGVMFSGREPTLNKRLPDYIARAKAAGMKNVTVETNALLFADAEMVAACRQAGLDAAFVSFHSMNPETVARLTRVPDSFQRTLQGIRNLLAEGVEVELNCVVNRHNYQELEDLAHFVVEGLPAVTSITFSFVAPLGQAEENRQLVPPMTEVAPYLRAALQACEEAGVIALVPGRCGVPFCMLPGLERFFVDYQLRHEAPTTDLASDRVKTQRCDDCRFDSLCHGLWAGYARLYGTDEILDGFWQVNGPVEEQSRD